MGTGKFAMQAFLEVPHLVQVIGVELTHARFGIAAKALKRLAAKNPARFDCHETKDAEGRHAKWLRLVECDRVLDFRRGDIFQLGAELIARADAIIMAVAFPKDMFGRVQKLLGHAKQGCRILTYEDLKLGESHTWNPPAPRAFHQLPCNGAADRYRVSWLPKPGHHFYLHEVGALQTSLWKRRSLSSGSLAAH